LGGEKRGAANKVPIDIDVATRKNNKEANKKTGPGDITSASAETCRSRDPRYTETYLATHWWRSRCFEPD
jgi:hypothetical protein